MSNGGTHRDTSDDAESESPDGRHDRRLRCRVAVTLIARDETFELLTSDVSDRGMYVRCDHPPALASAVRLRIALPPDDVVFEADGVVIHVLEPDVAFDAPPGFGVQLKALGGSERNAWDAFLHFVASAGPRSRSPDSADNRPISFAPPAAAERVRRRHPRHRVELQVRLETLNALKAWVTDDISRGGAFIRTDLEIAPGSRVRVHVVHPNTQELLSLDGVVARVERGVREGVAVQFTDMTDEMRDALILFISPVLRGRRA